MRVEVSGLRAGGLGFRVTINMGKQGLGFRVTVIWEGFRA